MSVETHPLAEQWHRATHELWSLVSTRPSSHVLAFQGNPSGLACPLPVETLGVASVACASIAAQELLQARGETGLLLGSLREPQQITVDAAQVGLAFRSHQVTRLNGEVPQFFAPGSGFYATNDGFVRTHVNYPHHQAALCRVLELPVTASHQDFVAAISTWSAEELEREALTHDALAVKVRSRLEWMQQPQGRLRAGHPAVSLSHRGAVSLPSSERSARLALARRGLPAAGFRVLDLTRVISGPVAARTLALVGADVLRIDSPRRPEIGLQYLDTAGAKRSTQLDFETPHGFERLRYLVETADVILIGYRPGCLSRFGLTEAEIRAANPHVILARVNAWGPLVEGGFSRGFDSLVQAATGIADELGEYSAGNLVVPATLPSQALDHATGYLVAAAIMSGLADVLQGSPAATINGSLLGTSNWLFENRDNYPLHVRGETTPFEQDDDRFSYVRVEPGAYLNCLPAPATLRLPNPATAGSSLPSQWPAPRNYGLDEPEWL